LLRYTQALTTQMTLSAVCNRHHTLDQQLCRWLLLSLDRLQFNREKRSATGYFRSAHRDDTADRCWEKELSHPETIYSPDYFKAIGTQQHNLYAAALMGIYT
jgi:hypothetical protein